MMGEGSQALGMITFPSGVCESAITVWGTPATSMTCLPVAAVWPPSSRTASMNARLSEGDTLSRTVREKSSRSSAARSWPLRSPMWNCHRSQVAFQRRTSGMSSKLRRRSKRCCTCDVSPSVRYEEIGSPSGASMISRSVGSVEKSAAPPGMVRNRISRGSAPAGDAYSSRSNVMTAAVLIPCSRPAARRCGGTSCRRSSLQSRWCCRALGGASARGTPC